MPDPSLPPPSDSSPLERPPPDRPWSERLRDVRLRLGLDARAAAWGVAAVAGLAVAAWLLRPAPTPLEEALPVASTEAAAPAGAGTSDAAGPEGAEGEDAASASGSSPSTSVPTELVAHAAGAVARPGVYRLAVGARVDDLVRAAGGLSPDADPARINLAAALTDGVRIYVPRRGEGDPPAVAPPDGGTGPGGGAEAGTDPAGGEEGAPIDINTATEADLEELPGVGPSIAAAIVAHREENGPFRTVDDLLDVRGIGEAKLAEIRPRATV